MKGETDNIRMSFIKINDFPYEAEVVKHDSWCLFQK